MGSSELLMSYKDHCKSSDLKSSEDNQQEQSLDQKWTIPGTCAPPPIPVQRAGIVHPSWFLFLSGPKITSETL